MTVARSLLAALAEISGCLAFSAWARLERSALWLIPGYSASRSSPWRSPDSYCAGRAHAAYGGVYIASSVLRREAVEGQQPDRRDRMSVFVCLIGAAIRLLPARG